MLAAKTVEKDFFFNYGLDCSFIKQQDRIAGSLLKSLIRSNSNQELRSHNNHNESTTIQKKNAKYLKRSERQITF